MAAILTLWQNSSGANELSTLLQPHIPHLYRVAFRLTRSEADAEDLLQELVIKLYARVDEIAELDKPAIWLTRVLYRMYVDSHRRSARRPVLESELGFESADPAFIDGIVGQESLQPERLTERHLEARRLQAALNQINPDQRDVVVLHDVEGYRLTELEDLLSLPSGTLKSRLHRGRRRLRELLSDGTF